MTSRVAFGALLAAALLPRVATVVSGPLWADEAESSINAFSILERGYPAGEHLGVPVFENMLIRPWPGHPEYEFKDISYTDRGVGVYHGWLPLVAIAGSLAVFGEKPPAIVHDWTIEIREAEWRRRTIAARLPSLLFGAAFLVLMYRGGRQLSEGAGPAVLVLAGLSNPVIRVTSQARYHSLMLMLTAAAGLTIWRIANRDRWRDHLVHALVIVVLFHTNVLASIIVALTTAVVVLVLRGTRHAIACAAGGAAVVVAGILPWSVLTGYLHHLDILPPGRLLLDLPDDLWGYAVDRLPYASVYALGLGWLVLAAFVYRRGGPGRLAEPWLRHRLKYAVLTIWMVVAAGAFAWYTPAASMLPERLSLQLYTPGLWLLALVFAHASRLVAPARAGWLAPSLAVAFLLVNLHLRLPIPLGGRYADLAATFKAVNDLELPPSARVYASPASHLVFSFYSDRPFQSIAPVRKSFLDRYPGEIVYVEPRFRHEFARPSEALLKEAAAGRGAALSDEEATAWARRLRARYVVETLQPIVAQTEPPLEPVPAFVEDAMRTVAQEADRNAAAEFIYYSRSPIFRGFLLRTNADFWQVFFYRLVDPPSRMGPRFNAAARLSAGTAHVVPGALTVVFHAPQPVAGSSTDRSDPDA